MSESEPQVQQQGSGDGKAVIAEAVATPRIIPSYTRIIGDKGPEDSPFVIIGEAPGKQEVMQGAPFVGPSGFILDHALSQFPKGSFPEPYVMNAVPHKIGGDKDQDLLKKYARDNWERVREIIGKHPRKVVLALGAVANMCVLNDLNLKITRVRGTRFPYDLSEHGVVASVHPAFLLRGGGSLRQFKADVAYAVSLASGGKPHEFIPPTWEFVDTPEKMFWLADRFNQLTPDDYIASDYETSGFSHRENHILCAGFTFDGKHVYVVPGKKRDISPTHDMTHLMSVLWDSKARYTWHNGKFDVKFSHHIGQLEARVDEDTMLMSYALDERKGIHDLETVAGDWLNSPNWKGVVNQHKKSGDSYDVIPKDVLFKYMAYDIANTFRLAVTLRPIVNNDAKSKLLYEKTLIPGSNFLARVERNGIRIDPELVAKNADEMGTEAEKPRKILMDIAAQQKDGQGALYYTDKLAGSHKQLAELLYDDLKIPTKDRTTGEDVLLALPKHPAVTALLEYRKIKKGLSTYVVPYTKSVHDDGHLHINGRIHQTYLIHGTATGRLACRDPNVQNVPRDLKLRGQFIPRDGYCFIEVDLNQAELRSLALLSGDAALCAVYEDPKSVGLHEELRRDLYGMKSDWNQTQINMYQQKWYIKENSLDALLARITEEQKMCCKNVNFGIVYGITEFGLADQIEDTPMEARRMLHGWGKKFPDAWKFINLCRDASLHYKNLVTVFGHKKRFEIVTPETIKSIGNESANFPHQSTASTITLHGGMMMMDKLAKEYDSHIVNLVHDSILIEVPFTRQHCEAVASYACDVLEEVPKMWGMTRIPFKAESKAGFRWGGMKDNDKFFKLSWIDFDARKPFPTTEELFVLHGDSWAAEESIDHHLAS